MTAARKRPRGSTCWLGLSERSCRSTLIENLKQSVWELQRIQPRIFIARADINDSTQGVEIVDRNWGRQSVRTCHQPACVLSQRGVVFKTTDQQLWTTSKSPTFLLRALVEMVNEFMITYRSMGLDEGRRALPARTPRRPVPPLLFVLNTNTVDWCV